MRARGVALITALLVVALAALAATALLASGRIAIHRTAAVVANEQGWWVARGVESWVLGILEADARESTFDALGEAWAQPVDQLPIEQGFLRGRVVDQQGCFNLNNLIADPAQGAAGAQAARQYQEHFTRLVAMLPDVTAPPGLVGAVRDWMDADPNPGYPSGAEDSAYLGLDPPYRAANRPFTVVSELLAVQGVTPQLYAALRDLVCVLPESGTAINVNTAPELVLRTLSSQTDEQKLRQFLERRIEKPYETPGAVTQDGIFGADAAPHDVKSSYFLIRGEVFVGSSRVALYSLVHRPVGRSPIALAQSLDAE